MSRRRKFQPTAQGAFGDDERQRIQTERGKHLYVDGPLPELPKDDGVAYERFGTDARVIEIAEGLRDLKDQVSWFGPSPFMVVLLKELIVKLASVSDTWFLSNLGIEDFDELKSMHEMSGSAIADYLDLALTSLPRETLEQLGMVATRGATG